MAVDPDHLAFALNPLGQLNTPSVGCELCDTAIRLAREGRLDESVRCCRELYHLGLQRSDTYLQGLARFCLGSVLFALGNRNGDWETAIDYLKDSTRKFHTYLNSECDHNEGVAWWALGRLYETQCILANKPRWEQAIEAYRKALDLFQCNEDLLIADAEQALHRITQAFGEWLARDKQPEPEPVIAEQPAVPPPLPPPPSPPSQPEPPAAPATPTPPPTSPPTPSPPTPSPSPATPRQSRWHSVREHAAEQVTALGRKLVKDLEYNSVEIYVLLGILSLLFAAILFAYRAARDVWIGSDEWILILLSVLTSTAFFLISIVMLLLWKSGQLICNPRQDAKAVVRYRNHFLPLESGRMHFIRPFAEHLWAVVSCRDRCHDFTFNRITTSDRQRAAARVILKCQVVQASNLVSALPDNQASNHWFLQPYSERQLEPMIQAWLQENTEECIRGLADGMSTSDLRMRRRDFDAQVESNLSKVTSSWGVEIHNVHVIMYFQ
ncbi:MAG: hypothetical protein HY782_20405 [Chloroflexi bacterium]|nr:hypothetical protein [Chloroflexota bacterium]